MKADRGTDLPTIPVRAATRRSVTVCTKQRSFNHLETKSSLAKLRSFKWQVEIFQIISSLIKSEFLKIKASHSQDRNPLT